VVHSGGERPCLEVGAPVTDDLDEADELPLISGQLGVLRRHGAAEGGDGPLALMEDYPEIGSCGIAVDDELVAEVRKLQDRCGCQGVLECVEGGRGVVRPTEPLLEGSQRGGDNAVVLDATNGTPP